MASTNITFDILANDRASSKFDAFGKSVDRSSGHLSKFSAIAKTAAKAGMLALGAGAVVAAKGLYEMGQAAVEDQAAAAKLATTLKTVAGATDGQIASVERWISAQGKAFGVTDDELRPSLQRLAEATHDVGKAQDLATLAMDVAAAKGKPLVGVSEALMKAYNGNIGALGRLGIKTKDAKGETLTFEQATKQMADTFGGAASAHADTLAGKMERLKVSLSEAGESIGYQLLPYVSDAADWLGDRLPGALDAVEKTAGPVFKSIVDGGREILDAVQPAVEEIAEALGHLTEEGGSAGHVFNDTFLPALRTASDVIAGLVNFVDELPGPVKDIGVQAGIAALILPKLTGAIELTSAAMGTAATRAALMKRAVSGAAGIAGMVALADGAGQANHTLGLLESTAGGALLGFSLAGPWGAAIGAGAGALVGLATSTDDAAGSMQDAKPKIQSMIDTLDSLTGATTAATRAAALQNLALKDGEGQYQSALGYGQELGLSQRTLVDAALGHAGAIKLVNKAIREQGHGTFDLVDANGEVIGSYTGLNASAKYLRRSLGLVNEEIRRNKKDARDAAQVTQDWSGKLKKFPKRAATKIDLNGVRPTETAIARLTLKYKNLDKKDIKTILAVTGVDASVRDIRRTAKELDDVDRKKPQPKLSADDRRLREALTKATQSIGDLGRKKAEPKATLDLSAFYGQRSTLLTSLNTIPDEHVTIWLDRRYSGGGGDGGGGNGGGNGASGRFTTTERSLIDPRMTTTFRSGGSNPFHGIGAAIIRAFAKGINGNAGQAENAVDKMMAAIAKALKNKDITEAAAKRMRETVNAMAREADKGRSLLQKRADFASTLKSSFTSELGLGELVSSEGFAGIGSIQGTVQALANRLRAFAGQLKELRAAGIPRTLIGEIASLGSDQGAKAAAAILAGSASEQNQLSSAYQQLQSAAGLAGNAGANAMYGSVRQIKQEFHINVHAGMGANGREIGREIREELLKLKRTLNEPLGLS